MKITKNLKHALILFLFASPLVALADSGKYVCISSATYNDAQKVADALNSLNCDTSKPVSGIPVAYGANGTNDVIVCCVQKLRQFKRNLISVDSSNAFC